MRSHASTSPALESIPIRKNLVVLSGYGVSVDVEHGRLRLCDGTGPARRQAQVSKATCGLKRLVILGHSGTVSLKALRWLRDIKASVVQIDADGQLVFASTPLTEGLTPLRRAQVLVAASQTGLEIVRGLLADKLTGQAEVAAQIGATGTAAKIGNWSTTLEDADDLQAMARVEAHAARAYWDAWSPVELSFAQRDLRKIPAHWTTFGSRQSPVSGSPRSAANPANAILNYLYAILEAETRIALLTVGLDPGLGLLHADLASRDSLACDVMEAARPQVDAWLLAFLRQTHFARADFFERPDGTIRITSRITSMLAETSPQWARAIAPVAERVASTIMRGPGRTKGIRLRKGALPTPLTQAARSAGRPTPVQGRDRKLPTPKAAPPRACSECGKPIRSGMRRFCSDECYEAYKSEVDIPRLAKAGVARLSSLRAEGADPSHGGEAGRKRGQSNKRRAMERAEWATQGKDLETEKNRFLRDILPALKDLSLGRIMKATGFSRRYASLVRRGLYVPHPIHYERLCGLVRTLVEQ